MKESGFQISREGEGKPQDFFADAPILEEIRARYSAYEERDLVEIVADLERRADALVRKVNTSSASDEERVELARLIRMRQGALLVSIERELGSLEVEADNVSL
jgi:biotin-(acetyl-CoA carboxylase) ligase